MAGIRDFLSVDLHPEVILKDKLSEMLQVQADEQSDGLSLNISQLVTSVRDVITAGLLCHAAVKKSSVVTTATNGCTAESRTYNGTFALWILSSLTQKLKQQVKVLGLLVPESFYLPAPPVFCPQPTLTDQVCQNVFQISVHVLI